METEINQRPAPSSLETGLAGLTATTDESVLAPSQLLEQCERVADVAIRQIGEARRTADRAARHNGD